MTYASFTADIVYGDTQPLITPLLLTILPKRYGLFFAQGNR
jgi:hypothetical protein